MSDSNPLGALIPNREDMRCCEGDASAEIIQSLAVAVQKGITKQDLDITMALHPTVTEELVTLY